MQNPVKLIKIRKRVSTYIKNPKIITINRISTIFVYPWSGGLVHIVLFGSLEAPSGPGSLAAYSCLLQTGCGVARNSR